jgi:hypothetical protein
MFKPSSVCKEGKEIGITSRQVPTGIGLEMTGHAAVVEHPGGFLRGRPDFAIGPWPVG